MKIWNQGKEKKKFFHFHLKKFKIIKTLNIFKLKKKSKMLRKLKILCFLVGGYKIGEFGYHSFQGLQTYYLSSSPDLKSRYGSGSYALISESSSQMGQEFSKELAKRDQNLILLSQNQGDLQKLQEELKTINPNIDIKAFELDSKAEEQEYYEKFYKNLEGLDISLFINALDSKSLAQNFEETSLETLKTEVLSTLLPGTLLLNHLLPTFQKRNANSCVITVGSAFGNLGGPYYSVSAGNMSFMNYLTRSLAHEVGDKLDVLLVTPGPLKKEGVFGEYECFNVDGSNIVKNSLNNLDGKKWIIGNPKQAALYYMMERTPKLTEKLLMFRGLMSIQANK